mmetsp:Transcript_38206/g.123878  ORF Transcript_38206/g.123878 Transcript_38206/m.123878 type:complete len:215 (+) Transcript_38206:13-657(+)
MWKKKYPKKISMLKSDTRCFPIAPAYWYNTVSYLPRDARDALWQALQPQQPVAAAAAAIHQPQIDEDGGVWRHLEEASPAGARQPLRAVRGARRHHQPPPAALTHTKHPLVDAGRHCRRWDVRRTDDDCRRLAQEPHAGTPVGRPGRVRGLAGVEGAAPHLDVDVDAVAQSGQRAVALDEVDDAEAARPQNASLRGAARCAQLLVRGCRERCAR